MRTLILSITCAFIFNNLCAQENDLALLDSKTVETKNINSNKRKPHLASLNSNYLNMSLLGESSNVIKKWKHQLANYNIKDNKIYDDSEEATYQISFKNKQIDIIAKYNNNSELLTTKETYRNIKLPIELMVKISKAYPNYAFIKNSYHYEYNSITDTNLQYYKVKIGNGKDKITFKINKNLKISQRIHQ